MHLRDQLITMYYERLIDKYLSVWTQSAPHKPILLRGARHNGKSTAVRHLGESFDSYVEINFEKNVLGFGGEFCIRIRDTVARQ